jgi:two-component system sensor histidine kinase RegB
MEGPEPVCARNPAILYGLGNLLENAVDFARTRVEIDASWSDQDVTVVIADDGPGFAPEIISRIGEPYVTSRRGTPRRSERTAQTHEASGLGLGVFIAKTLLERSGAVLEFKNRALPERGASIRVRWGRLDFEAPAASAA